MRILSNYKIIFIIIGIAVVVEIIWAVKSLGGNVSLPTVTKPQNLSNASQNASIILSIPKTTFKVGEKIPVSIMIDSGKATDGTDVILNFDTSFLTASQSAEIGTIYDDYPLNNADNVLGKISISGISSVSVGKVAKGLFGTVIFEAKVPGKSTISVDFTSGSTTDSNIIETKTAQDLLGKVQNIGINVTP